MVHEKVSMWDVNVIEESEGVTGLKSREESKNFVP